MSSLTGTGCCETFQNAETPPTQIRPIWADNVNDQIVKKRPDQITHPSHVQGVWYDRAPGCRQSQTLG